jgi:hypothetical protein
MKSIIGSQEINNDIRDKLRITIKLHPVYEILANVIAFLYYLDIEGNLELVYPIDKIHDCIHEYQIVLKGVESKEELKGFLDEMVDMGVLWSNNDRRGYRLLRESFVGTIGTRDEVDDFLVEHSG